MAHYKRQSEKNSFTKVQKILSLLATATTVFGLLSVLTFNPAAAGEVVDASDGAGYEIPNTGFFNGKAWLDARYRYERVQQDALPSTARASTIRVRPGIESGFVYGFRFGVEADLIGEVGPDDFNNTINGKGTYPVVVDVQSAEVNRAYVESHHLPGVLLTGGRYKKNLDNMRYIGSVDWRQNDQTFDGATVEVTAIPDVNLFYGYIGNVNRIFSDRAPAGAPNDGNLTSNIHLFNAKWSKLPLQLGTLVGYGYLIDIKDRPGLSNASFGAFINGKYKLGSDVSFNYYAEYARQHDYGTQPVAYDANYIRLAPGITFGALTTTFVYEKLGSDNGVIAFQTPLATGHVFNGFADIFLATPGAGLEDFFVDVTWVAKNLPSDISFLNGLFLKAQYHEFRSDIGGIDYGSEFDFYAKLPFHKGMFAEFKYANYAAENFGTDTEKLIFGLGYKY